MRGRKRLLSLVALLSILLIVPLVVGLGVLDVSRFLLTNSPASSTPLVFVFPDKIIKDYLLDPGYQIGDKFLVHVNISDVTDLFSWQVNITWNPNILNFSRVKEYGPFLRGTTSPNGTSGWIDRDPTKNVTIAPFNNTLGFAAIAETILDSRPDAVGVSGYGSLVSIEFLVVGYGCSNITISLSGNLATMLLNSTGGTMAFTTADGWFNNKIAGDSDGSGRVNVVDIAALNGHWWPSPTPPYPTDYRPFDNDDNGAINIVDIAIINANWDRHYP